MPQANVNEYITALRADLKSSPQAKKLALNSFAPQSDGGIGTKNIYNQPNSISGGIKLMTRVVSEHPEFMPFVMKTVDDILRYNTERFATDTFIGGIWGYFPHDEFADLALVNETAAQKIMPLLEEWKNNGIKEIAYNFLGSYSNKIIKVSKKYPSVAETGKKILLNTLVRTEDDIMWFVNGLDGTKPSERLNELAKGKKEVYSGLADNFSYEMATIVLNSSQISLAKKQKFIEKFLQNSLYQRGENNHNTLYLKNVAFFRDLPSVKENGALHTEVAVSVLAASIAYDFPDAVKQTAQKLMNDSGFRGGAAALKLLKEYMPSGAKAQDEANSPNQQAEQRRMLGVVNNIIAKRPQITSKQKLELALNLSKFNHRTAQAHAADIKKIQKTLKIGGVTRKALDFYVLAGRKGR